MSTLQPVCSACFNYLDSARIEQRVTVIITPIRIKEHVGTVTVTWGCSRGHSCRTASCFYSMGGREERQMPIGEDAGFPDIP